MQKSQKVFYISFIILIGFTISLAYHYVLGFYLGKPYPYNTFLFLSYYHGSDFGDIYRESVSLSPYLGEKSGQYPFMLLLGKLFTFLPVENAYILFCMVCTFLFGYFCYKYLKLDNWLVSASSIFIIAFLSYPFLFCLDRANFELLLFIFLVLFIFLFERKKYLLSTIPLAIACAMKIYPCIFLVLFITEKKWKEAFATIGLFILLSLTSILLFQGGFWNNINYLLHLSNFSNNNFFQQFTSIAPGTVIQRGVTLFSLIKLIIAWLGISPSTYAIENFIYYYFIICALLGIISIFIVIKSDMQLWKKVGILTFLMLLLPPISGDYKLIHVFLPLLLFCNDKSKSKIDEIYVMMFALLLIPKDYFVFSNVFSDAVIEHMNVADISISVPINIALLIVFTLILFLTSKKRFNNDNKQLFGEV